LSKNTVRKGLELLVSEGLIEKVQRIGTRVADIRHKETVTLKFGYYPTLIKEINLLEMIEAFHSLYPNIRIQGVPMYYPRNREIVQKRLLADEVDVMTVNAFDFEYLSGPDEECGILETLERNDGIHPFLTKRFSIRGKILAHPLVFTPVILCYNKDHFREMNFPEPDASWTWEDVRTIGSQLSDGTNRFGLYFHRQSEHRWPLFLLQSGVVFQRNAQGRYHLSDPKLIESMRLCMNLTGDPHLFPSYLSENDSDVHALFLQQKVSMVVVTYDSLNAFRDAPFAYDIAPLPYIMEPRTLVASIAIAINRESKNKLAAQLLLDYMLSYENQLHIRKHTLSIPSLKLAAEWSGPEPLTNRPSRFHMY
jgi:multiple sugar transport system substrate-binding protein